MCPTAVVEARTCIWLFFYSFFCLVRLPSSNCLCLHAYYLDCTPWLSLWLLHGSVATANTLNAHTTHAQHSHTKHAVEQVECTLPEIQTIPPDTKNKRTEHSHTHTHTLHRLFVSRNQCRAFDITALFLGPNKKCAPTLRVISTAPPLATQRQAYAFNLNFMYFCLNLFWILIDSKYLSMALCGWTMSMYICGVMLVNTYAGAAL